MDKFIILGDNGSGNKPQYLVAKSMEKIVKQDKINYVVGLGDNIYDFGVDSSTDKQFHTKFEKPYKNIPNKIKFYMCLGNHDYDYPSEINNRFHNKSKHQIEYSKKSKKWHMPSKYYEFEKGKIQFVVCDTNLDFYTKDEIQKQINFIVNTFKKSKKKIKILVGHHTWTSIGGHGRALPLLNRFFNQIFSSCKDLNIYMCGHDHCKTHIIKKYKNRDVHLFICGTGGEGNLDTIYNLKTLHKNESLQYYAPSFGVGVCKVIKDDLLITFYDIDLNVEYQYKLSNI